MKKPYATPDFGLEIFTTEDILTASVRALPDEEADWLAV